MFLSMRRAHTVGSCFMAAIQSRSAGVWFTQLQDRRESLARLKGKRGHGSLFRLTSYKKWIYWGNKVISVTLLSTEHNHLLEENLILGMAVCALELQKLLLLTLRLKCLWTECSGEIRYLCFTVCQQKDNPLKDTSFCHSQILL